MAENKQKIDLSGKSWTVKGVYKANTSNDKPKFDIRGDFFGSLYHAPAPELEGQTLEMTIKVVKQ